LAERIQDLDALLAQVLEADSDTPIFTLGHDWGGVVSLGWASNTTLRRLGSGLDPVGMMSLNTAVWHDQATSIPAPLQAALAGPVLPSSTVVTPAFLNTTLRLGHPALDDDIKLAYKAPYNKPAHRGGIGGFVADIPTSERHRSRGALRQIATSLSVTDKPAL